MGFLENILAFSWEKVYDVRRKQNRRLLFGDRNRGRRVLSCVRQVRAYIGVVRLILGGLPVLGTVTPSGREGELRQVFGMKEAPLCPSNSSIREVEI